MLGRLLLGLFTSALPLLPVLFPAASRGSSWLGRCRGERRIDDRLERTQGHGGVLVQRILMNFSYFQWVIFRFQPFIFRSVNCTRDAGNNAVARTSTCQRTCRARITLCVDGPLVFVVDPNSLLTDHGPKQVKLRKRI